MKRVTLDTNAFPLADDLVEAARGKFELAHVTVTEREVESAPPHVHLEGTERVSESLWLGDSRLNEAVLVASEPSPLDEILGVIDPNFPADRSNLSKRKRRLLRDAMIFEAHVREGRDIFVSNDRRAFVRHGRREALERRFGTKILTRAEFERLIK